MKKSRFTETQITFKLQEADAEAPDRLAQKADGEIADRLVDRYGLVREATVYHDQINVANRLAERTRHA